MALRFGQLTAHKAPTTVGRLGRALVALALHSALSCGDAPPLDVELPPGAYATWEESPPIGDPAEATAEPDEEPSLEQQPLGARRLPSLRSLSRPEFETVEGEEFLNVSEEASETLRPSLCQAESSACGGDLDGDWIVDDSCDASKSDPDNLWRWGQRMLNLRGDVCFTAVKSLTTLWDGALNFHANVSTDERLETNTLRVVLGPECLTATLQSDSTVQTSEGSCRAVQSRANESTYCQYEPGRCVCTSTTYRDGAGSGLYRYEDDRVRISNQSAGTNPPPYRYCIESDERMVWWEPDTGDRLVMKRKDSPPWTLDLPREISIRAPR